MEGVYVYHWYRADVESRERDRDSATPQSSLIDQESGSPATVGKADRQAEIRRSYNQISDVRFETVSEPGGLGRPDWRRVPIAGIASSWSGHDVASAAST